MKEIHWFNFADARRPDPVDTRLEGKAQNMGLIGPSDPLPSKGGRVQSRGRDNIATTQEKRAAEAGAAARGGGAGGVGEGRKDRCVKGKSCGATCITQANDCILELPETAQAEIRKMAEFILKKKPDLEAGSAEDIRLGQAAILAGQNLRDTGGSKGSAFTTSKTGESRLLSALEIRDLKENRDQLGKAEFDQKALQAWQKDVNSRGLGLNRQDLELLYQALPPGARDQLNRGGNPGKGNVWYGKDKEGNDVTDAKSPSKDRGLAVLDMYFKQGGTDAYGKSSRVLSPGDLDVEHVRPVSKGGKDHPSNWVLARSGAQRQRANEELGAWIDKLPNPSDREALRRYYDVARKKNATKGALKAVLRSMDIQTMPDEAIAKISGANLKYLLNDVFTANSGLYGLRESKSTRSNSAQPAAFNTPYAMAVKYLTPDQVKGIKADVRRAWNKNWIEGGGSTKDMISELTAAYQSRLPPEVYAKYKPDIDKWSQKILEEHPETAPRSL
jgi:hypothetical protein